MMWKLKRLGASQIFAQQMFFRSVRHRPVADATGRCLTCLRKYRMHTKGIGFACWFFLFQLFHQDAIGQSGPSTRFNDLHFQTLDGKDVKATALHKKMLAVIFLSPECPLSQNYTLTLNKLYAKYKSDVDIVGVFPGSAYSATAYNSFNKKYDIKFTLVTDKDKRMVKLLGAKITPEVFLMDERRIVFYSGAIDNWAISLGKQRTNVTEHYLEDAIQGQLDHVMLKVKQTKAVGCLINDL
jgi:peroxiredoxin